MAKSLAATHFIYLFCVISLDVVSVFLFYDSLHISCHVTNFIYTHRWFYAILIQA